MAPRAGLGRPVAIDLFSGVGGLSLGLEQAGFDVLAAVDSDPISVLTYQYNFPGTTVLCDDIAAMTGRDLTAAAKLGALALGRHWSGEVDCIAGGPSCQGFSVIGSRDPADPRNSLVLEFARLVAEVRPRYFILENVPGLLTKAFAEIFETLVGSLAGAGYNLGASPWKLDSYNFRVPQRRRRIFLVGARNGLPVPRLPGGEDHVTAGEAIGDLLALARFPGSAKQSQLILDTDELRALMAAGSPYARQLRTRAPAGNLATPRLWDRSVLTGAAETTHADDVRRRFAEMKPGVRDASSRLPKLDAEKPSPTLRAGTGREHGSHTSVRPIHYHSPRVVTVREAARLHSFPDWFRFHTTRWHALRQIGNSVPPGLGRAVASAVISALAASPTRRSPIPLGDPLGLGLSLVEAARALNYPVSRLPPPRRRAA